MDKNITVVKRHEFDYIDDRIQEIGEPEPCPQNVIDHLFSIGEIEVTQEMIAFNKKFGFAAE
ncbi:hypothetical protein FACS1894211_14860 [Clostridia bacterium]|nr:hypothetical protein FACS1894211_14860 [Clostridia bacterium]